MYSPRRKLNTAYCLVEAGLLLVALCLWTPPNIYILSQDCKWFDHRLPGLGLAVGVCLTAVFTLSVVSRSAAR